MVIVNSIRDIIDITDTEFNIHWNKTLHRFR